MASYQSQNKIQTPYHGLIQVALPTSPPSPSVNSGAVLQSRPTLCDPMDCSPPDSSVHGDSPGKNTGVCCHALLQGTFPTQGLNPGLPLCRQILYCLSHQGSPTILEWVAYLFSRGSSTPGIELGFPALQVDSLPAELLGKPPVTLTLAHMLQTHWLPSVSETDQV